MGPFPSRNVSQIPELTAFVDEYGQHLAVRRPDDVDEVRHRADILVGRHTRGWSSLPARGALVWSLVNGAGTRRGRNVAGRPPRPPRRGGGGVRRAGEQD